VPYEVIFRATAEADLDAIDDFIAQDSPERAFAFVARIRARCESLVDFPHQGTRRDDISPGLRTFGFERRATIAFRIEGNTVEIVSVLYGGRDLTAEMFE
jgi:toxin ParE1/3/4